MENHLRDVRRGKLRALNRIQELVEDGVTIDFISGLRKFITSNDKEDKITWLIILIKVSHVVSESDLNQIAFNFMPYLSIKNIGSREEEVLSLAGQTLGRLISNPNPTIFEIAEQEISYAIEVLEVDSGFQVKYAACNEIKEICSNLPILLTVHMSKFLGVIWNAIRERESTRDMAIAAIQKGISTLSAPGDLSEKLFTESFGYLRHDSNVNLTYGAVLILQELLKHSLINHHCDRLIAAIATIKDHKQLQVRKAVVAIIPELASKSNLRSDSHFNVLNEHLARAVQLKELRIDALESLGAIAQDLKGAYSYYLPNLSNLFNAELKKKPVHPSIFVLLKGIVAVAKFEIKRYIDLDGLVANVLPHVELSIQLVDWLINLNRMLLEALDPQCIDLIYSINDSLLGLIYKVLNKQQDKPYGLPRNSQNTLHITKTTQIPILTSFSKLHSQFFTSRRELADVCGLCTDHAQQITKALALYTLANFDFYNTFTMKSLVASCVLPYLEDQCALIRQQTIISTCVLTECPEEIKPGSIIMNELLNVLERILNVALTDNNHSVRQTIFKNLESKFYPYLAHDENLSKLMTVVNDKNIQVRKSCVRILGHLLTYNFAFVMPSLTQLLSQYLGELQISSNRKRRQENSAILLKTLIQNSRQIIVHNLKTIIDVYTNVAQTNISLYLTYQILLGLGACAEACSDLIDAYYDKIFPLIIENLKEKAYLRKKGALIALSKIVTATGWAIQPYHAFPTLLPSLIDLIKTEEKDEIRKLAQRSIGIIGALNPTKFDTINRFEEPTENTNNRFQELSSLVLNLTPSNENYYPLVALRALIFNLQQAVSTSDEQVKQVLRAISNIYRHYFSILEQQKMIIPILLEICKAVEPVVQSYFFEAFRQITMIIKNGINEYVNQILDMIDLKAKATDSSQSRVLIEKLRLLKELGKVSGYEIMGSLSRLLHDTVSFLDSDDPEVIMESLKFIKYLRGKIDQHLSLVIPMLLNLTQNHSNPRIRSKSIKVTKEICDRRLHPHCVDFVTRIIQTYLDIVQDDELISDIFGMFAFLVENLGNAFAVYIPVIQKVVTEKRVSNTAYENAIKNLIAGSEVIESPLRLNSLSDPNASYRSSMASSAVTASFMGTPGDSIIFHYEMNADQLLSVIDTSGKYTREEWKDWMRRFSNELLRQAPSPALRECQVIEDNSLDLFNASFMSCWTDLYDDVKNQLVMNLEAVFNNSVIPVEVLQILLNLIEFMEHDDQKLFNARRLGEVAQKCKAYAKALHYKEIEFYSSHPSSEIIGNLIDLNNLLQQTEAAGGIRTYARKLELFNLKHSITFKDDITRWEDAEELNDSINELILNDPSLSDQRETTITRMKCLKALYDWRGLKTLTDNKWHTFVETEENSEVAAYGASAAWNLAQWDQLKSYTQHMEKSNEKYFYNSILSIHDTTNLNYERARKMLRKSWDLIDSKLPGLLRESYIRAYPLILEAQQLCELEELIDCKVNVSKEHVQRIARMWDKRLEGCQKSIEIWGKKLSFRTLLLTPEEDLPSWITFAKLCRKGGHTNLARETLETLFQRGASSSPGWFGSSMYYDIYNIEEKKYHDPKLCFEYLKYLYNKGPKSQALDFLKKFIVEQESNPHISAYYLTLANWQRVNISNNFESPEFAEIIQNIKTATQIDPKQTKAWHKWGIVNFEALTYYERHKQHEKAEEHVDFAIDGFVQSLSLNPQRSLQDILRLITLWFNYGGTERIDTKIRKSFDLIKLSVWLEVIPQIIARYNENLRHLIEELMLKIALHDPQAIIYSLTMAATMSERKDVAETVISRMKENYPQLVSDALLVTSELIRAAILWNEAWHEGITEASWLYYTANKDIEGMKAILLPLHEQINRGPETMNEVAFFQAFSGDLDEAELWMQRFDETREEIDLQQAWNIYYNVYTRLRNKLATKEVELKNISPNLAKCENLELSVPGNKTIKITKFYHTLKVFASAKTHPKRLYMAGSDGKDHAFLLKGHEDLRQDERAMQLFSLVNNLLASNSNTSDKNLAIRTYHVGPLSQSCGLIGWMHGTDTLSQLIQEYREKKNIELNVEKSLIISMTGSAEKYEKLPLLNKIEIFEHAMSQTKGEDLQRILWLQSNTSEIWLERRTNYTRSLATISMVGYILGLGDRHPSNIMLDRASGKIVHVDFGDCFEVAMKREKAPEKVPFRLTRMIENAMEISGIDGNFRNTCEQVMSVLRGNRNSLLAMLEVFLYDPIVGWKLLSQTETEELQGDQLTQALNQKAIDVIDRIQNKLKGTDFPDEETLNVKDQVNRLISEARSLKNLAQHYLGWCPFW